MSTIFDQNFDSFPAGSPYLGGTIVDGGADPSPLRSFRGVIQLDLPSIGDLSIFMSYRVVPGIIIHIQWFTGTGYVTVFELGAENDGSLSMVGGSGYFQDGTGRAMNTIVQSSLAWCPGEWVFIHLHAAISGTSINADLTVNQLAAASGSRGGYDPHVAFDRFIYSGPSLMDNLTIKSADDSLPHPAPEVPPGSGLFPSMYARMDQIPFEHLDLPDDAPVRLSQAAIERLDLPDDERVRLSQAVIELIQKNSTPPPQLLPQYIKRHTLLAN